MIYHLTPYRGVLRAPFRACCRARGAFPLSARPSPRALFLSALGLVGLVGGLPSASFIVPLSVLSTLLNLDWRAALDFPFNVFLRVTHRGNARSMVLGKKLVLLARISPFWG